MPATMGDCSICSPCRRRAAILHAARRRAGSGQALALPAPAPIFPRYVEPDGAARAAGSDSARLAMPMLRCHAHRQPLPSRLSRFRRRARRGGRARQGGGRRAHDHDLDARRSSSPRSRRSPSAIADIFFTVGTHPHQAHEEPEASVAEAGRASRAIRNASASARPASTTTTIARRATSPRASSAPISRLRAQSGLPLVIHARDADDDMAAILQDEMGKGAFTAVLHCFTAVARARRDRAWRSASTSRSPAS